jgi:membrane-associated PAP2 superfamily phosphatase
MSLYDFLSGAVSGGFAFAALFFLRFWRRTKDGLFLWFAGAFLLLGLAQALLSLGGFPVEERSWVFLLRLAAFSLILLAIYNKNRATRPN